MIIDPNMYHYVIDSVLAGANAFMGASFTGVARAAFEEALAYSKQRVQGGKAIAEHQSIQLKLMDMFIKVEAARQLSRAAMVYNQMTSPPATQYSIASKVFCTEAAFSVASEAVQVHGGYGLAKEMLVEKLFRDARASMIEDGTNEVLSLAAARKSHRHVLGQNGRGRVERPLPFCPGEKPALGLRGRLSFWRRALMATAGSGSARLGVEVDQLVDVRGEPFEEAVHLLLRDFAGIDLGLKTGLDLGSQRGGEVLDGHTLLFSDLGEAHALFELGLEFVVLEAKHLGGSANDECLSATRPLLVTAVTREMDRPVFDLLDHRSALLLRQAPFLDGLVDHVALDILDGSRQLVFADAKPGGQARDEVADATTGPTALLSTGACDGDEADGKRDDRSDYQQHPLHVHPPSLISIRFAAVSAYEAGLNA